jgi:hypothetical protein
MILFTLLDISWSKLQDCSHYKRNDLLQISYKKIIVHVQFKYWESIPILCSKVFICTRMKHFSNFKVLTFGLSFFVFVCQFGLASVVCYNHMVNHYKLNLELRKNRHVISSHLKNNNNSDKYSKGYFHVTL